MKHFYISCLIAIIFCLQAGAQTRPQPSMYIFNYSIINPAAFGAEDYSQVRTGYRRQWVGIEGAPATAWLNGEIRLGKTESSNTQAISKGHGVGVNIYQDAIGPYKTINLNLGYAYHLPLSQSFTLSAGFAGGLHRTQYDMGKSVYPDQTVDPAAIAQASTSKKYSPDLNAGILLNGKNFFAGVSVMQMLPVTFVEVAGSEAKLKQQFLGMLGYNCQLDEEGSALQLSGVVKSDFAAPVRYDLNARVRYQTLGFIGASYRKNDAFGLNLGLNITKSITAGYMYEWGIDRRISTYAKGNHEFCLGFRFLKADQSNRAKMGW